MKNNLIGRIKNHFREVIKIKKSPHSIALGFALGTFIAILPTFGLGLIIGLIIVLIFKKVNKLSLIAAFILWNPFVVIPIYLFSYRIGDALMSALPIIKLRFALFNNVYNLTLRLLVGNFIIAFTASVLSYFSIKYFAKAFKKSLITKKKN